MILTDKEGGVAVYIGDTLNAKSCPLLEPDSDEFIRIDLYDHIFYRPPNTPIADFIDGISSRSCGILKLFLSRRL